MFLNVSIERQQADLSKILQPFPQLNPKTLFPSFDYVDKPYADILDSLASILLLWIASAIFMQCIQSLYGRNTKSIAFHDFMHQMLNLSFTRLRTLRRLNQSLSKTPWRRNLHLRLCAAFALVVFIGIDALVVFSQTSKEMTRSLNSLQIRRLAIRETADRRIANGGTGCRLMVERLALNDDIPLYFCTEIYIQESSKSLPPGKVEIYFEIYDSRFFKIIFPRRSENAVTQFSVQIRDDINSVIYYANLTAWECEMSASQVQWIANMLNEECPLCQVECLDHSFNVAKLSAISEHWTVNLTKLAYMKGLTMIGLSDELIRSEDFVLSDHHSASVTSDILTETTSGSVKRLSGVILWIIAGVLQVVRLLAARRTWDVNDELDDMVAAVLDLPPPDLLCFSPDTQFEMIKLGRVETEQDDDLRPSTLRSFRLALQRKG